MVRALIVIVLAAHLLVCPLRCLSCGIDTLGGDMDVCVVDQCCHECENSSGEKGTSPDDCSCQNCICEGATVETVCVLVDEVPTVFVGWLSSNCDLSQVACAIGAERPPIESAGLVMTPAMHQVWLI